MKLNLEAETPAEQKVKAYLEQNASEVLAHKINEGVKIVKDGKTLLNKKTLAGFLKFACDEAKKQAEKGAQSACIDDDTVYGWAVHYFEEDGIEGTLCNEDGTEYKAPMSKAAPLPTKYEPQEATQTPPPPPAQPQDSPAWQRYVDPETGEVIDELSEEEMQEFDGDIDETLPDTPVTDTKNTASMPQDEDEPDMSAFDMDALCILSELFGNELELR